MAAKLWEGAAVSAEDSAGEALPAVTGVVADMPEPLTDR